MPGGSALAWATYYQEKLNSDQGCLNEWMAMSDLESFRSPNAEPGQSVPGRGGGEEEDVVPQSNGLLLKDHYQGFRAAADGTGYPG